MCGIAAIIRSVSPPGGEWSARDAQRLRRAMVRLRRRGPDGRGVLTTPHAILGHTRLAIQDPSAAATQPMQLPDTGRGTLTLVYNGEVYNGPALRDELRHEGRRFHSASDTEVLLHAIDHWGIDRSLDRIRGMFAFVAVREHRGSCVVHGATDPAGMKPLVWSRTVDERTGGPALVLASDCDAANALRADQPRPSIAHLRQMLSVGYIPAPHTAWEGVHKLGPGEVVQWRPGPDGFEARSRRHWAPPGAAPASDRHDDREFPALLREVSSDHLAGDVPVGLFLSAGMDSASIALALRKSGADMARITAYTLCTGGERDDAHDESRDAARVAGAVGMPHRVVRFAPGDVLATLRAAADRFDEPQGYTAILTMTAIAGALRREAPDAKVVLGGDGGDECLGGYAWHRDDPRHPLALTSFAPPDARRGQAADDLAKRVSLPDATSNERIAALHALGSLSFAHRLLVRTFGGFHPAEAAALLPGGPAVQGQDGEGWLAAHDDERIQMPRRAQRLDLRAICAGSILPKLDRACMGVGLECRAPYLDRRMLDWGLSRPVDAFERTPAGSKPALRAMLARAVERGGLPRTVLTRPKQGFSLRAPDGAFAPLMGVVRDSRLLRDGVLHERWPGYLTDEPETRRTRLFAMAMLAAWYERRC